MPLVAWPPGRSSSIAPTCGPARRSSSTPAPVASDRRSSSSPSTSGPRWRPPRRKPRGAGPGPRRRRRGGLHQGGLRRGAVRLRPRAGFPRGREPREVADGAQARWTGHQRHRPARAGFAKQVGAPWFIGVGMSLLSRKIRKQAETRGVRYSFFFMQANGSQLRELAALYDTGQLRPVIARYFRSTRRSRRWHTSSRAAPTARSSSRSTTTPPPPNTCTDSFPLVAHAVTTDALLLGASRDREAEVRRPTRAGPLVAGSS